MAAFPEPVLMTVEEFDRLPDRRDVKLELHAGCLVELSKPKYAHVKLQRRIAELLVRSTGPDWSVLIEMPFRALPQYEFRSADIGVVAKSREDAIRDDLFGSPDIVIEILSPSNRAGEIRERASLFLSTGTKQFCVVDADRSLVRVTGPDSKTVAYGPGEEVPFPLLGISLPIDEIFA